MSLSGLWNSYQVLVSLPIGFLPGPERYIETACVFAILAIFLYRQWRCATESSWGPLGTLVSGSDEQSTVPFSRVLSVVFVLTALHFALNYYNSHHHIPKSVTSAKQTSLNISITNELADIAHRHGMSLTTSTRVDIPNLEMYLVGSDDTAALYAASSWFSTDASYQNFLTLFERACIKLEHSSELKNNIVESSLFGVGALGLGCLYVAPLTTVLLANFVIWNTAYIATVTYKNHLFAAWSRYQTYAIDAKTAQATGEQRLIQALEFSDSATHYDQLTQEFPAWKFSLPRFSARIKHLASSQHP